MTRSEEARAVITGSFILFLVNSLVENNKAKTDKHVKKLRKVLLQQTSLAQYADYVRMSNDAWGDTVDTFKEKNYRLIIFDAVEHLTLGEEKALLAVFGEDVIDIACEFCMRFSDEDIPNDGLAESREICKYLTKTLKKMVFERVK